MRLQVGYEYKYKPMRTSNRSPLWNDFIIQNFLILTLIIIIKIEQECWFSIQISIQKYVGTFVSDQRPLHSRTWAKGIVLQNLWNSLILTAYFWTANLLSSESACVTLHSWPDSSLYNTGISLTIEVRSIVICSSAATELALRAYSWNDEFIFSHLDPVD